MIIYEKDNKLYGTLGDIPNKYDSELEYRDENDIKLTLEKNDLYFDNKSGGIIRKSDGKTVNIYINGVLVIPQDSLLPDIPEISTISDYLSDILIDDIDYEFANKYFKESTDNSNLGLCTSVWKDGFLYRSFDWNYNHDVAFKTEVSLKDNDDRFVHGKRFRSIGVADSIPYLTSDFVKSKIYSIGYKLIPFRTVDGINENHIGVSINVVPTQKGDNTRVIPTIEIRHEVMASAVVRFILDNFESAQEAVEYIQNYVLIYPSSSVKESGYDIHYLICDLNHAFIAELINGKFIYKDVSDSTDIKPIITNFHVIKDESGNVIDLDENGKVFTPASAKLGKFPSSQGITSHGAGLERYNIIVDNYRNLDDFRNLVYYNKSYTEVEEPWYSEFAGDYHNQGLDLELTVDNIPEDYENTVMPVVRNMYLNRNRDTSTTWHTTHTTIYDLENLTMSVYDSSEDNKEYKFSL